MSCLRLSSLVSDVFLPSLSTLVRASPSLSLSLSLSYSCVSNVSARNRQTIQTSHTLHVCDCRLVKVLRAVPPPRRAERDVLGVPWRAGHARAGEEHQPVCHRDQRHKLACSQGGRKSNRAGRAKYGHARPTLHRPVHQRCDACRRWLRLLPNDVRCCVRACT